MKHKVRGRKLGRTRDQRKALLKIMAGNLILKERIKTTDAKARELRPYVEKVITKGRKNTLANNRLLAKAFTHAVRKKLFTEIGPRYANRAGGYTRIIKTLPRQTDGAKMAYIELVK